MRSRARSGRGRAGAGEEDGEDEDEEEKKEEGEDVCNHMVVYSVQIARCISCSLSFFFRPFISGFGHPYM